ncbi:hypothetical protein [Cohnella yongneupensis]|uniref:Acid shock protein n=1 Tax=Cohnella yongneupensis TaxID=425006 RepID=A0ABW0QTT9_9BACL
MKKTAIAIVSACMIFTASSAAYAAVPAAEKKHEHKLHAKSMHHKMHAKSKTHAKSLHAKSLHAKSLHAKSLRAKDVSELPKTGFGGASEQTE